MSWFFFALIAPLLYSLTNHIDKVLLEKYFKEGGVGTLLVFSALASAIALPIFLLIDPEVLQVSFRSFVILMTVGILNILVIWFYLLALKDDEASIIIVFYQLVPVIGLILGYIMLGETVTKLQLIAMAIIILGTSLVSFEIDDENNFKLKKQTIILMTAAAFFWAMESVLFKTAALEENVLRSLFWEHLTLTVIGILIFTFVGKYRKHFLTAFKRNSGSILSLNFSNEGIYMLGNVVASYAYMLAPVALILLTESFQPIFVFAIGIFLTIFFPKISVEDIHTRKLLQKLIAIIITGIGTYLLLQ